MCSLLFLFRCSIEVRTPYSTLILCVPFFASWWAMLLHSTSTCPESQWMWQEILLYCIVRRLFLAWITRCWPGSGDGFFIHCTAAWLSKYINTTDVRLVAWLVCLTASSVALAIPYSSLSNTSFSRLRWYEASIVVIPDLMSTTPVPDFPFRRDPSEYNFSILSLLLSLLCSRCVGRWLWRC